MSTETREQEAAEPQEQDEAGADQVAADQHEQAEAAADQPGQAGSALGESGEQERAPLLAEADVTACRGRWDEVQAGFVDRPREAVEQADALVADVMERLTAGFAEQRSRLEGQWDRGDDISTEELRVALTRYRSFFNRLLAA
jgi:hypothetical protein